MIFLLPESDGEGSELDRFDVIKEEFAICALLCVGHANRDGTLDDRFVRCDGQGNHLFSTRTSVDATEIPIVDSYKYLGLHIDKNLDVTNMANKRLDGHAYKYRQLYKLFRNPHVTADLKRLATLTDFMPKTMYAPEVWGIGTPRGSTLLGKIQAKLTRLAKAAIRPGGRNPHAQVAMREMGLTPVADITALQTMRLFNKCITMRGYDRNENLLSELLHSPDPRSVTLKAERNAPLYSLKTACNIIVEAARSASTLQYLNLERIGQA